MNLGWLLLKNSGRQGSLKFVITMIAAALGMLILLGVFSIANAFSDSQSRQTWITATYPTGSTQQLSDEDIDRDGAVLVNPYAGSNYGATTSFLGRSIDVLEMYHTGGAMPDGSPLETMPGKGEYYVSRGLDELLRQYDDEVFADRYDGEQVGIIDDAHIQSPDELLMIRGVSEQTVRDTNSDFRMNATVIDDFTVSAFGEDYDERNTIIITTIMSIGALGLIIPVMILISTATRLGASEREKRYSALRLTGATKKQIRTIALVDSLAASGIGVVIGLVIFWLLRPLMFAATFNGERFYPEALTVQPLTLAILIAVIFGLVWLTNKLAMRRVITSPLGVVRRQKLMKPPKIWSVIPLVLALGALVWLSTYTSTEAQDELGPEVVMILVLVIFIIMALGMILAGGWITKVYGSVLNYFGRGAKTLLVSRHIKHEARSIYRGVSGVVLAFFVGAFFITALGTVENYQTVFGFATDSAVAENTIVVFGGDLGEQGMSDSFTRALGATHAAEPIVEYIAQNDDRTSTMYYDCRDVERLFSEPCEGDEQYLAIPSDAQAVDYANLETRANFDDKTIVGRQLYYVPQPGTSALDAEQTMTSLARVDRGDAIVRLVQSASTQALDTQPIAELKALLYIGIVVTVIVASLSLVVATVAGLFDRKDSFATLRLSGAGLPLLKRTVVLESMLPLAFVSALSVGIGIFFAKVFIQLTSTSVSEDFLLPELGFWLAVLAALVISYVGIRLVLPMLGRLTNVEHRRTE